MQNANNKFKYSITSGFAKGWSGFLWMLKIILPISFCTALLAWSNVISKLDFMLEPVMGAIGLPPMAAIPLIAGVLTGIYGGIAAMVPLALTVDQMTLIAIFLIISHNLIQEGVVQSKSGLPFFKATVIRMVASILAVMVASRFLGHDTAANALADAPVMIQATFFAMVKTWTVATLILSGKMLAIVMILMLILEFVKNYNLIDHVVNMLAPVLKIFGLSKQTGFLWITAVMFGLTFGAAVIVEEAKEGKFTKDELERLQLSIGINHSIIEDPVLFLSLGIGTFWLWVPRFVAAIIVVHLFIITKRLISLPGFPKFFLWQKR